MFKGSVPDLMETLCTLMHACLYYFTNLSISQKKLAMGYIAQKYSRFPDLPWGKWLSMKIQWKVKVFENLIALSLHEKDNWVYEYSLNGCN